jgi:hypothetical protein
VTAVLAGLRAEAVRANIGDIRATDEGSVFHVCGNGNKALRISVEQIVIDDLEAYLDSSPERLLGARPASWNSSVRRARSNRQLMKLLGHESMVTSQWCVTAAGTETHTAAAQTDFTIYSKSRK